MKYLSLFSGIGAFEKALTNLGIEYDLVNYCEIDKYASKCYSALYGVPETKNLWDITKVNEKELPKNIDLVTYGFPCQDISNAGKQKGFFNEDGSQTRSGLFFDALRIIKEVKPKVAIAENVKALTQNKFKEAFSLVLESLEDAGYNNYWQVLNAKDYGVAQNRERVFIVSIRKDIDTGNFVFPDKIPLKKKLKDYLEDTVDSKYYLSEKLQKGFEEHTQRHKEKGNSFKFEPTNGDVVAYTATTREGSMCTDNFLIQIGQCYADNNQAGRVYSKEGLSPTLNTCQGGNLQPKIIDDIYNHRPPREYEEYSPTLRNKIFKVENKSMVRRLTPKECWRLMGFADEDFEKCRPFTSDTQLYKQAGNSIVVNVCEEILRRINNEWWTLGLQ